MPVVPNNGKIDLAFDDEADVAELMQLARGIDRDIDSTHRVSQVRLRDDIADCLFYVSATNPEWAAPYADEAFTDLQHAIIPGLATASLLFGHATDATADAVAERLAAVPTSWNELTRLAAIDSDHARQRFADHVRGHEEARQWANRLGMHVPETGPAVQRFLTHRTAIHADEGGADAIGNLPLGEVRGTDADAITWHHLSLATSASPVLDRWPFEWLHLVAARTAWFELQADAQPDGRLAAASVEVRDGLFDDGLLDAEHERDAAPISSTNFRIQPFDASHTYTNGHIYNTPGVVGVVGGCPVGLDPTPVCSRCEVLMFHAATIEVRDYGEGFRSVALCDECRRVGITGSGWN